MNDLVTEVPVTDKLVVLAARAKVALARIEASRQEWIEATFELADALREARERLPSNDAFSFWLQQNGLEISKDDRGALINLAGHAASTRRVLERYPHVWSWRAVWDEVRGRRDEARRLRSLRTRGESAAAAEVQPIQSNDDKVVQFPVREAEHSAPLYPPQSRYEFTQHVESLAAEGFAQLIFAIAQGATPAATVQYWRKGRGDLVPEPSDIETLTVWLKAFAKAAAQPRKRKR